MTDYWLEVLIYAAVVLTIFFLVTIILLAAIL